MRRKILSICSFFIMPAVLLMTPLVAQSDPADLEEVARMKVGHQQVEGVVVDKDRKSTRLNSSHG